MRKLYTVGIIALIAVVSIAIISLYETTADPSPGYSYTYDGYTVTQTAIEPGTQESTVSYSVEGPGITGTNSYKVYFRNDGALNGIGHLEVAEGAVAVVMVPPYYKMNDNLVKVSSVSTYLLNIHNNIIPKIQKLYILTDQSELLMKSRWITAGYSSLTDLVIVGKVQLSGPLIVGNRTLERIHISEFVSDKGSILYDNAGRTEGPVEISLKTIPSTTITNKMIANPMEGVTVKLLPGSVNAKELNLTNISEVYVDKAWPSTVSTDQLADKVVSSGSVRIIQYGGTPSKYVVAVPQSQNGVAIDKTEFAAGDTVTITLSPGEDMQVAAVKVKKLDGNYVDAVVSPQDENVYSFVMPATNVTITATFEDATSVSLTFDDNKVARGALRTGTISTNALKGVKSLFIRIDYDSENFILKSMAPSGQLAYDVGGNLNSGDYAMAFESPQNISGALMTFELQAKNDANLGSYTISCIVEVNGSYAGGVNNPDSAYNSSSTLTIGASVGDLNSDGRVDEADAVYLLFYTFRSNDYPIPAGQIVDYTKDGKVDSDDAIYLKNHIQNPTQYPIS